MAKVKLDIDKIAPGMQLAEPITNARGITLMPAGIRLTPMFILRLKKWNISELEVIVDDKADSATSPAPPEARPDAAAASRLSAEQEEMARGIAMEVSRWFVNVRENALMMDLRAVVVNRLVAHGREGLLNRLRVASDPGDAGEAEA